MRAEEQVRTAHLITLDSLVPLNNFSLYPTAHMDYEYGEGKQLQLSYCRRVKRPEDEQVNPFPEYKDPRNVGAGNPYLKPEQIHSVELGYQLRTIESHLYKRYSINTSTTDLLTSVLISMILRCSPHHKIFPANNLQD